MTSHGQAIIWEICRKNLAALVACVVAPLLFLALIVVVSLSMGTFPSGLLQHPNLFDYREEVSWGILLLIFITLGCVAATLVILNYTESEYKSGENHFPSRTFHFPASTLKLVTLPLTVCVLGPVSIFLLWQALVFIPLRIQFPILIPVLSLVAGGIWLQVFIWKFPGIPAARLTSMVLGMLAVVGVNLPFLGQIKASGESVRLLQDFAPPFTAPQLLSYSSALIPMLLLCGAIGYWFAIRTVESERRGRDRGKTGATKTSANVVASNATLTREGGFKHRMAAHAWFEMKRNGFGFPLATIALVVLANIALPFIIKVNADASMVAFFSVLAIAPMMAAFSGIGFCRPDFWAKDGGLSPFLSNWPISNPEIIRVKLSVALKITLVACAASLAGAAALMFITGNANALKLLIPEPITPLSLLLILEGVVLYLAITWRFLTTTLPWGLSGRPKLFVTMAIGLNLAGLILLLLTFGFFTSGYSASLRRLTYFPMIIWVVAVLIVIKAAAASTFFLKCKSRQLLSNPAIIKFILVWLVLSIISVHFALQLPRTAAYIRHSLAFISVLLFPLARLPLTHLLLHWNRHQRARSFGK